MGVVVRQSILASIISYAGVAVGYVNTLYLYPRFLNTEQIGLLRTIQDVAMLMAPFAQMGLAQSIIRFYPHFSKENKQSTGFINFVLLFSLIGYGLFIIIFFLLKGNIISFFESNAAAVSGYIGLILWMTFLLMVTTLLEYYSRSLLKIALPNFLREIGIRLMQGILVTLYFLKVINFDQFLFLSVAIYIITLGILTWYLMAQGDLKINFSLNHVSSSKAKEILVYSVLSLIGSASIVIIGKIDSVMVAGLAGLTANAIYTTSFYIATVIEIPKRAITQSAATLISKAFEKNDLAEVQSIYRKTAINQFIIGTLLLIGIWANLENIFQLMPKGDIFKSGMYVVLIVGMAKLIDMAFGPNGEIIVLSKYYWFNMVTVIILAVVGVMTNFVFIPKYGIMGAAYATALALIIFNFVKWIFVYRMLHLQPFSWAFVKVLIISAAVITLSFVLPKAPHVLIDIVYRSALITIVFGVSILASKSSEEINNLYRTMLTRIKTLKSK